MSNMTSVQSRASQGGGIKSIFSFEIFTSEYRYAHLLLGTYAIIDYFHFKVIYSSPHSNSEHILQHIFTYIFTYKLRFYIQIYINL